MERKFAFEKVDNLFMAGENSVWESDIGKQPLQRTYIRYRYYSSRNYPECGSMS